MYNTIFSARHSYTTEATKYCLELTNFNTGETRYTTMARVSHLTQSIPGQERCLTRCIPLAN